MKGLEIKIYFWSGESLFVVGMVCLRWYDVFTVLYSLVKWELWGKGINFYELFDFYYRYFLRKEIILR